MIGIDIGTTEVRAGLFDRTGGAIAIARRPHVTVRGADGRAEQDPEDWWRGAVGAVGELGPDRSRAIALSVTGQGPTLVPSTDVGVPTRPAITWLDARPARLAAGDPDGVAGFTLRPAIRWMQAEEPSALDESRWLLNSWDWLALRLTGVASASHAPGESPLRMSGFEERLGTAVAVADDLGPLAPTAAEALGLSAGTRVVAGTNDGAATIVGAGLRHAGDAVDVGGASGGIAILASSPADVPGIYCAPSLLSGRWIVGGAMMAIGGSFDWLRGAVLGDRWTADELLAEAAAIPAGSEGLIFLPYLAGERSPIWDDEARGSFVGLRAAHTRGHLVRAVLEGGAMALRHVASLAAPAGATIRELRLAGRPATSRVWSQIKSDVMGVAAVTPAVVDASILGAATIAAVGGRLYVDLDTAIAGMRADRERSTPRPSVRPIYDALFDVYLELYPALRPSFARLAAL